MVGVTNGIEIAVQIRAPTPDQNQDVPAYYTRTNELSQACLDEYASDRVVELAMETTAREVIAEYLEEHNDE